jgi:hypothetical protein
MTHKKMEKADIHITIDMKVLKAAKIKCIEDNLILSDVIAQLLQKWLNEK